MEKVANVGGQAGPGKTNKDTHSRQGSTSGSCSQHRFLISKSAAASAHLLLLSLCRRWRRLSSRLLSLPLLLLLLLLLGCLLVSAVCARHAGGRRAGVPRRWQGLGSARCARGVSPAGRQHSASTAPAQRSKAPAGHQRTALLAGARGAPGAWPARPPAQGAPAAAALSFFSFFFFLGASSPSPAASPRVAITSCGSGRCRAAHIAITPVRLAGYTQGSTASSSGHDAVRNDEWRSGLFILGGEHAGWGGGGVCAVAKREKRQRQRQRQRAQVGGPWMLASPSVRC